MGGAKRGGKAPEPGRKKPESKAGTFPVVGIGASAGGLEVFEQLFRLMPRESEMAFVLVSHLDPGHISMLAEILGRVTPMPVVEAKDRMPIAPNHVYVIPPNRDMTLFHGKLLLVAPADPHGQRMPIDLFFRSLAEDVGERAVGVILSGTGTDGTQGVRAIVGAGGICMVQDPATAKYEGMPDSAVRSGLATFVLAVEKMPAELAACTKRPLQKPGLPAPAPMVLNAFGKIVQVLRTRTGQDFSLYKKNTVCRRVERRMAVHGIEKVGDYAQYLQEHPEESQLLFKELLINVTSFFRDPEAFAALKNDIFPPMLADRPDNATFRVWAPGCATGEEAYSLGILLRECMDEAKRDVKVQIYATDLDDDAIATARAGFYLPNVATDMAPERLRRFFTREDAGYRVKRDLREMIVFAVQNVVKDPPFTKLDMVCCRNLLIYLEPELQDRLMLTFHYALKPGGVLFLSPSESIGNHTGLFTALSRKHKLYQARPAIGSNRALTPGGVAWIGGSAPGESAEPMPPAHGANVADVAKRMLLQSFAPPSVVTDEKGNILYVHGDTGRYLRPAPGQASLNVIDMARQGLQMELRTAIHSAIARKKPVHCKNLRVKTNGDTHDVDVRVHSLAGAPTPGECLIISFHEAPPAAERTEKPTRASHVVEAKGAKRLHELEDLLLHTRETLQANNEELQASNEELKSANEELQSTNEELQSTNEELETSREELQSVNEELMTVNAELQSKNDQLTGIQNDLRNLLDNMEAGTIFLDDRLVIKRFTRQAATAYRLAASDVGRPLGDIKSNIVGEDLVADAQRVLDSLVPVEKQVRTEAGVHYRVRIQSYRTLDNVIEGAVLTFTDISELKKVEAQALAAGGATQNIVDAVRVPLVVLDGALTVISASRAFYHLTGLTPTETVGRRIFDVGRRQLDIPRVRELLENVLPLEASFEGVEIEGEFPGMGRRKLLLNGQRIAGSPGASPLILLELRDRTEAPGPGDAV